MHTIHIFPFSVSHVQTIFVSLFYVSKCTLSHYIRISSLFSFLHLSCTVCLPNSLFICGRTKCVLLSVEYISFFPLSLSASTFVYQTACLFPFYLVQPWSRTDIWCAAPTKVTKNKKEKKRGVYVWAVTAILGLLPCMWLFLPTGCGTRYWHCSGMVLNNVLNWSAERWTVRWERRHLLSAAAVLTFSLHSITHVLEVYWSC